MGIVHASSRFVGCSGRLAFAGAGAPWFTSIMGTGILAITLRISPIAVPGGPALAALLWSADTLLFALFSALWLAGIARAPRAFATILRDPARAQVLGAPPMACFTIAVGFVKIGTAFLPPAFCIGAAQGLFVAGAFASIACAFAVPYLMFTQHELSTQKMYGNWLLPVVPPIALLTFRLRPSHHRSRYRFSTS